MMYEELWFLEAFDDNAIANKYMPVKIYGPISRNEAAMRLAVMMRPLSGVTRVEVRVADLAQKSKLEIKA